MKKIISILLVVLAIFSLTVTAAFAEGETAQKPLKITFYDDNGTTVKEVIYVDYGFDYNHLAPKFDSYTLQFDGVEYKIVHEGWTIMNVKYYKDQYLPIGNLPVFAETDGVTEVKVKAQYKAYENTIENNIKDTVENLPGGELITNAGSFFSNITSLLKSFFEKFLGFIQSLIKF